MFGTVGQIKLALHVIISFYKGKGQGERSMKCQQSLKIDGTCLSRITVEECIESGLCTITYILSHTGHAFDVCHLPTPEDIKTVQRVSVIRIMDNTRDASLEKGTHLMLRQDINNIKRALNLYNIHKHTNDSTGTAMWVAELREAENVYNPILAYKPQGEFVDEIDDIPKECFLLCFQSEFQRDRYDEKIL